MAKNEYLPDYPKTIADAVEMLQRCVDEDDTKTEFMNGYRMGLRMGINALKTLERINNEQRTKAMPVLWRCAECGNKGHLHRHYLLLLNEFSKM